MGGLVARSAIAQAQGRRWPSRLQSLVTLGTPHLGAPLERGGQQVQQLLAVSAYSRPLAGRRPGAGGQRPGPAPRGRAPAGAATQDRLTGIKAAPARGRDHGSIPGGSHGRTYCPHPGPPRRRRRPPVPCAGPGLCRRRPRGRP
ncbi:MAG: hypothetical protein ACK44A_08085 [Roseateles sp.]